MLDSAAGQVGIHDLATGDVGFQAWVDVGFQQTQLSYDGERLAVCEVTGATEVFDVRDHRSYTIEASGILP